MFSAPNLTPQLPEVRPDLDNTMNSEYISNIILNSRNTNQFTISKPHRWKDLSNSDSRLQVVPLQIDSVRPIWKLS